LPKTGKDMKILQNLAMLYPNVWSLSFFKNGATPNYNF